MVLVVNSWADWYWMSCLLRMHHDVTRSSLCQETHTVCSTYRAVRGNTSVHLCTWQHPFILVGARDIHELITRLLRTTENAKKLYQGPHSTRRSRLAGKIQEHMSKSAWRSTIMGGSRSLAYSGGSPLWLSQGFSNLSLKLRWAGSNVRADLGKPRLCSSHTKTRASSWVGSHVVYLGLHVRCRQGQRQSLLGPCN